MQFDIDNERQSSSGEQEKVFRDSTFYK